MELGKEGEGAGLVVLTRTKSKPAETADGSAAKPGEEFAYAALVHRSRAGGGGAVRRGRSPALDPRMAQTRARWTRVRPMAQTRAPAPPRAPARHQRGK